VRPEPCRESVDVVIDLVGGTAFCGLLEVLRRGGRYAVAGAIAGPVVNLDLRTLYLKDLSLLGCTVTTAEQFRTLVRSIEQGLLRPLVGAVYPLRQVREAQEAFLGKAHAGKIVLVP
jgi:NADPH:quinone reductase-like Zn-dependent oxidoreductase